MGTYRVTLPKGFAQERRVRAGVIVTKAYGYEGELTDEQLEAIKADELLTVTQVKDEKKSDSKKK